MQIRTPMSRRRAMKPSREARIVNHVGRPWMLEGKRFLPETGIPIWKMVRMRMLFEDWLPEPLAVATWIEKSLITGGRLAESGRFSSRTAVDMRLLNGFGHGGRPAGPTMIPNEIRVNGGRRC